MVVDVKNKFKIGLDLFTHNPFQHFNERMALLYK